MPAESKPETATAEWADRSIWQRPTNDCASWSVQESGHEIAFSKANRPFHYVDAWVLPVFICLFDTVYIVYQYAVLTFHVNSQFFKFRVIWFGRRSCWVRHLAPSTESLIEKLTMWVRLMFTLMSAGLDRWTSAVKSLDSWEPKQLLFTWLVTHYLLAIS